MTFATSYEGYDLAFIGVPVAIIAALILFVLLINSLIKMLTTTTNRNLKIGMAVLFFMYMIRSRSSRSTWAELLRRVFALDVLTCPQCGGPRRLIARLTDPTVVRKILTHLGHPTEPPRSAPARSPEQFDFA